MKMNSIINILLFTCLLVSCGKDPNEILTNAFFKCQTIQNGYYEMIRSYIEGKEGPGDLYSCYFSKLKEDSLFSSAFYMKRFYNGQCKEERIYTGEEYVNINLNDSTAVLMPINRWAKEIVKESNKIVFYSPLFSKNSVPLPGKKDSDNSKNLFKLIGVEKVKNISCYHVQVNEKPEDEIGSPIKTIRTEYHYWISKSDSIPIQYSVADEGVMVSGVMKGDTLRHYTRDVLIKYELNNQKEKSKFTLQSIPENYKIIEYAINNEPSSSQNSIITNWQLNSIKGEKVNISNLKGKLVLIEFFYNSCIPCLKQMPALEALHEKYNNKGLQVISINTDNINEGELAAFLSKHGVTYTVLRDGKNVANAYHVNGYPSLFLYDRSGKIIYSNLGYNMNLQKELEPIINSHIYSVKSD